MGPTNRLELAVTLVLLLAAAAGASANLKGPTTCQTVSQDTPDFSYAEVPLDNVPQLAANDFFGQSLAQLGEYLAVGAPQGAFTDFNNFPNSYTTYGYGYVAIYQCVDTSFYSCVFNEVVQPDAGLLDYGAMFGYSVAWTMVNGTGPGAGLNLFVGAPLQSNPYGAVYIFTCDGPCVYLSVWTTSNSLSLLGFSITVYNSPSLLLIVSGTPGSSSTGGGFALYECGLASCYNSTDESAYGIPYDGRYQIGFTANFAPNNAYLVVSDPGLSPVYEVSSAVHMLDCTPGTCSYSGSIGSPSYGTLFGFSVAFSGDNLYVGTPNSDTVYVYSCSSDPFTCSGSVQTLIYSYLNYAPQTMFGRTVTFKNGYLAVSSPDIEDYGLVTADVQLFDCTSVNENNDCNYLSSLAPSPDQAILSTSGYGTSLLIADDLETVFIGTPSAETWINYVPNEEVFTSGRVFFNLPICPASSDETTCQAAINPNRAFQTTVVGTSDDLPNAQYDNGTLSYGTSVAFDGTLVVVGDPGYFNNDGFVMLYTCELLSNSPSCAPTAFFYSPVADSSIGFGTSVGIVSGSSGILIAVGAPYYLEETKYTNGAIFTYACPTMLTCPSEPTNTIVAQNEGGQLGANVYAVYSPTNNIDSYYIFAGSYSTYSSSSFLFVSGYDASSCGGNPDLNTVVSSTLMAPFGDFGLVTAVVADSNYFVVSDSGYSFQYSSIYAVVHMYACGFLNPTRASAGQCDETTLYVYGAMPSIVAVAASASFVAFSTVNVVTYLPCDESTFVCDPASAQTINPSSSVFLDWGVSLTAAEDLLVIEISGLDATSAGIQLLQYAAGTLTLQQTIALPVPAFTPSFPITVDSDKTAILAGVPSTRTVLVIESVQDGLDMTCASPITCLWPTSSRTYADAELSVDTPTLSLGAVVSMSGDVVAVGADGIVFLYRCDESVSPAMCTVVGNVTQPFDVDYDDGEPVEPPSRKRSSVAGVQEPARLPFGMTSIVLLNNGHLLIVGASDPIVEEYYYGVVYIFQCDDQFDCTLFHAFVNPLGQNVYGNVKAVAKSEGVALILCSSLGSEDLGGGSMVLYVYDIYTDDYTIDYYYGESWTFGNTFDISADSNMFAIGDPQSSTVQLVTYQMDASQPYSSFDLGSSSYFYGQDSSTNFGMLVALSGSFLAVAQAGVFDNTNDILVYSCAYSVADAATVCDSDTYTTLQSQQAQFGFAIFAMEELLLVSSNLQVSIYDCSVDCFNIGAVDLPVSAFSESYDFGASVAISETFTHIVVGAPNSTVNAVYDQGTVFIFSPATQGPNFRCVLNEAPATSPTCVNSAPSEPDREYLSSAIIPNNTWFYQFGTSVASAGPLLAVGASEAFSYSEGAVAIYECHLGPVAHMDCEFNQYLTVPPLSASGQFAEYGSSVAFTTGASYLIVGASYYSPSVTNCGAVFIYSVDLTEANAVFNLVKSVYNSEMLVYETGVSGSFGTTVAAELVGTSTLWVLAGDPNFCSFGLYVCETTGLDNNCGAASSVATFYMPSIENQVGSFGATIAIANGGGIIAVGDVKYQAVYVYYCVNQNLCELKTKIIDSTTDNAGLSIAFGDNYLVVGSAGDGMVFVHDCSSTVSCGNAPIATIIPDDSISLVNETAGFGTTVYVKNNVLTVLSTYDSRAGDVQAAFVFACDNITASLTCTQLAYLPGPADLELETGREFASVAMTDDSSIIFIGTPSGQTSVGSGAVLAFQPDQLGNNIKCQDVPLCQVPTSVGQRAYISHHLPVPDLVKQGWGFSIAEQDGVVAVGVQSPDNITNGAVYLYNCDFGLVPAQCSLFTTVYGQASTYGGVPTGYGSQVALANAGAMLAVSAPFYTTDSSYPGAVFIYQCSQGSCELDATLPDPVEYSSAQFGYRLALVELNGAVVAVATMPAVNSNQGAVLINTCPSGESCVDGGVFVVDAPGPYVPAAAFGTQLSVIADQDQGVFYMAVGSAADIPLYVFACNISTYSCAAQGDVYDTDTMLYYGGNFVLAPSVLYTLRSDEQVIRGFWCPNGYCDNSNPYDFGLPSSYNVTAFGGSLAVQGDLLVAYVILDGTTDAIAMFQCFTAPICQFIDLIESETYAPVQDYGYLLTISTDDKAIIVAEPDILVGIVQSYENGPDLLCLSDEALEYAPSATASFTESSTASFTESATASFTESATASFTESATASFTESATASFTESATVSFTESATESATVTYAAGSGATAPSAAPTTAPSAEPTTAPSAAPTTVPSAAPTTVPSAAPSTVPSAAPTTVPPAEATTVPSAAPTTVPSVVQATPTPTPLPALSVAVVPRSKYVYSAGVYTFGSDNSVTLLANVTSADVNAVVTFAWSCVALGSGSCPNLADQTLLNSQPNSKFLSIKAGVLSFAQDDQFNFTVVITNVATSVQQSAYIVVQLLAPPTLCSFEYSPSVIVPLETAVNLTLSGCSTNATDLQFRFVLVPQLNGSLTSPGQLPLDGFSLLPETTIPLLSTGNFTFIAVANVGSSFGISSSVVLTASASVNGTVSTADLQSVLNSAAYQDALSSGNSLVVSSISIALLSSLNTLANSAGVNSTATTDLRTSIVSDILAFATLQANDSSLPQATFSSLLSVLQVASNAPNEISNSTFGNIVDYITSYGGQTGDFGDAQNAVQAIDGLLISQLVDAPSSTGAFNPSTANTTGYVLSLADSESLLQALTDSLNAYVAASIVCGDVNNVLSGSSISANVGSPFSAGGLLLAALLGGSITTGDSFDPPLSGGADGCSTYHFVQSVLNPFSYAGDYSNTTVLSNVITLSFYDPSLPAGSPPITIQGLDAGSAITISLPIDPSSGVDATSPNVTCVFWNTTFSDWSDEGCTKDDDATTATTLVCSCSHLTDFALGTLTIRFTPPVIPPTIDFASKGLIVTWCTIAALIVIFIGLAIYAIWMDSKHAQAAVKPEVKDLNKFIATVFTLYDRPVPHSVTRTMHLDAWNDAFGVTMFPEGTVLTQWQKMYMSARFGFRYNHSYVSIFFAPISMGTRFARVSCTMSALFVNLAISAMFFQYNTSSNFFDINSIQLKLAVGFITSIITFLPFTLLQFFLKRIHREQITTFADVNQLDIELTDVSKKDVEAAEPAATTETVAASDAAAADEQPKSAGSGSSKTAKRRSTIILKKTLSIFGFSDTDAMLADETWLDVLFPFWVEYIVYAILLILALTSIVVTGIFGADADTFDPTNNLTLSWIQSFFISVAVNIVVLQTLQAIIGAAVAAIVGSFTTIGVAIGLVVGSSAITS